MWNPTNGKSTIILFILIMHHLWSCHDTVALNHNVNHKIHASTVASSNTQSLQIRTEHHNKNIKVVRGTCILYKTKPEILPINNYSRCHAALISSMVRELLEDEPRVSLWVPDHLQYRCLSLCFSCAVFHHVYWEECSIWHITNRESWHRRAV